jgi:hypothetical protein
MSEHQFAFGVDRAARLTVADDGDGTRVRVTLIVRGLDGIDHAVSDIISQASAVGIAAGFREAAGEYRQT